MSDPPGRGLPEARYFAAVGLAKCSGNEQMEWCYLQDTTASMSIFQPQFLTVHDGCCLHEAHAFAAVGLAKYSSHESRYPSSVTLRSNGRSLPLRLINFAVQELDLFGLLRIILSFPLHHSHRFLRSLPGTGRERIPGRGMHQGCTQRGLL